MKSNCQSKCCENKSNSLYIKRILQMIGPVILGSKPAEIVALFISPTPYVCYNLPLNIPIPS